MKKKFTFLLLFLALFASPRIYGQNILTNSDFEAGTLGANTPPSGWSTTKTDYNDPSSATNNPRVQSPTIIDEWVDFDDMASNNASQDGGRAIGATDRESITYDLSSTSGYIGGGVYTIYFEFANPGLNNGFTGDGYWRFRLGGNTWTNGPTISAGTSGTMEWSVGSLTVTAGTAATPVLQIQARESVANADIYLQIDNIILIPECTEDMLSTELQTIYADVLKCIDVCYPQTTAEAQANPGVVHMNPASCNIIPGDPDPLEIVEVPVFDCANATPISFDTPVLPANPRVLYHYWGNCAPLSPAMPEDIAPSTNGYIQQMFCETDAFGLPAFPGGLSGENGIIDFLPKASEDVGCNGFVEAGTTCACGQGSANNVEKEAELIQLDFWMAVPNNQTQVGFRFSEDNRQDAGAFFVGASLDDMCEVAFYTDGPDHDDEVDQASGTFNINGQLVGTCGLLWMRVRVYINDIADQFVVSPEINAGNGWVDIDQLLIEPALSADDNVIPTISTTTVSGYLINGMFIYSDGGTWDPYGCNPVTSGIPTGICAPLPVELISFNAALNNNQITLKWQTAAEENNSGFVIQKSSDGKDWEVLDWVNGSGTTSNINNYTYLDKNPYIGENYYRLKQIDYDGQFKFSNIVNLTSKVTGLLVEVSPNPSPGEVNVTVINPQKEKMTIELYDSAGILIWKSGTLSNQDMWTNKFNLAQKELYFLTVQIGKEVLTKKILIIDKF